VRTLPCICVIIEKYPEDLGLQIVRVVQQSDRHDHLVRRANE
jgi:hypothetical protein